MGPLKRILIAAILVVAFVVPALAAQNDAPQPKIVIPKVVHDFGEVFEQEAYVYEFVVRNRGKADLVIENVKPG